MDTQNRFMPTWGVFDYAKKIAAEGGEVEEQDQALLGAQPNADHFSFLSIFPTERGLYARAHVIRDNEDGTIGIYEVKSSASVKAGSQHYQIKDAAFQKIAADEGGAKGASVFILHLNSDYVWHGMIVSSPQFQHH